MEHSLSNVKYTAKMTAAFLCAFLVVNFACCFYSNSANAITNPDRYTEHKFKTKNHIFYGKEGYGITATDKNGFYNDGNVPPERANVLCIGSSQTEALQVHSNHRYVSQLNHLNSVYNAYSLGVSGQFLDKALFRLPYIPKSFPRCKLIINETPSLPTMPEWNEIIRLLEANDAPIESQDWKDGNLLYRLYRSLPYAVLIRSNVLKIRDAQRKAKTDNNDSMTMAQYKQKANHAMQLLRERLGDMPLIIMYLPRVHLEKSGHITISNDDECQKILKEACEANHILYVYDQLSATFIENYETHRILPYGFLNSHIGQGHLNAEGHRMIAETLHKILQEEGLGQ